MLRIIGKVPWAMRFLQIFRYSRGYAFHVEHGNHPGHHLPGLTYGKDSGDDVHGQCVGAAVVRCLICQRSSSVHEWSPHLWVGAPARLC